MATTTEKYYILQNEQGMFFQGLASRAPKKTPVKAIGLEIEYCDDPLHAARGKYEGEGVPEELTKIAQFVNATPRVLEITAEVKTTDGQPAPKPNYEAADQLVRTKDHVNFAGLAGIFAGFNLGE
ncbi:hypothetical protein vbSpy7_11 [Streptococcus phage vb_Spy_7]|nr:hypothetical protein vbSpy7_11 [Streptococcus phage vb_Spy_7]